MPGAKHTVKFHTEAAVYQCAHVLLRAAVSASDNMRVPPVSIYTAKDRNKCLFGPPHCACTMCAVCVVVYACVYVFI